MRRVIQLLLHLVNVKTRVLEELVQLRDSPVEVGRAVGEVEGHVLVHHRVEAGRLVAARVEGDTFDFGALRAEVVHRVERGGVLDEGHVQDLDRGEEDLGVDEAFDARFEEGGGEEAGGVDLPFFDVF